MSSAARLNQAVSTAPDTPLVNLFAYIRDLFTTTQPSLRFDQQKDQAFWSLHQLNSLQGTDLIHCQWESPNHPILELRRGASVAVPELPTDLKAWVKIVQPKSSIPQLQITPKRQAAFDESVERIQAYREFYQEVHGKAIEDVQHLQIPAILDKWLDLQAEQGKLMVGRLAEAEEKFGESELRKELLIAYRRAFEQFQRDSKDLLQINAIYDALHELYYSLTAQADRQICLSFGLVSGEIGKELYRNFLFHIPLKLTLNKQILRLEADTLAHVITCEQYFSELLGEHFAGESEDKVRERKLKILREVDHFNSKSREFNFHPDYLRGTFYETAIRILEVFPRVKDLFFEKGNLNYHLPETEAGKELTFSFSPTVHVRSLASGVQVAHDAENIIAKINELGNQGKNEQIPDFFKKLFSLRKPGNPFRIAYRSENKQLSPPVLTGASFPNRFLFPLPYNQEQLSIAQQLLKQDAVTVQGPPGTGKSHTIANLASHFVAEGKSILIVSKNAKALEVIKGKLPAEIRSLAVALLEGTQNQEELKHAIDAVKNHLSQPYDPAEIDQLESEMSELEAHTMALQKRIIQQISTNQRSLELYDPTIRRNISSDAAEWIQRWSKIETDTILIPDPISYETDTESWIADLIKLQHLLLEVDLAYQGMQRVDPSLLPDWEAAQEILVQIEALQHTGNLSHYQAMDLDQLDDSFLSDISTLEAIETDLLPYQNILRHPRFDLTELEVIWGEQLSLCQEIEAHSRELLKIQVDLKELSQEDPEYLLEELLLLMGKYSPQGKLGLLKKKMLPSIQKQLLGTLVNRRSIRGLEDLMLIQTSLEQQVRIKQIGIVMNNYLSRFGIPGEGEDVVQIYHEWAHLIKQLKKQAIIQEEIAARKVDMNQLAGEKEVHTAGIKAAKAYQHYVKQWHEIGETLTQLALEHPIVADLKTAWSLFDRSGIEAAFEALEEMEASIAKQENISDLTDTYAAVLPEFMKQIRVNPDSSFDQKELGYAIFARKLESWLTETLNQMGNPNSLLEELQGIRKQKELLVSRLVAEKTWQRKQATVTDQQRSSLTAWRNDLINIGKGYGKNTERNMTSAVANMQLAREVVPIWIMQQKTAISFFPDPEPGQFDLLIVDEASQCDISMLNLIFRCKKCIIVGDENQTSVATQSRLFPIARTNQLLDRYLVHHPFRQQFNINNRSASIYTLSGVIYPNIISLREHFRCRPELIGFSNRYVYDQHIIPLRTAEHELYGSATEVHYIEDNPEDARKGGIVKGVLELISGLIEDVKSGQLPALPTVGILCLESSNEAHRELLIRELGRHPKIKLHADELQLLVGTSREFQGDERDIMILTTTASHKFGKDGSMKAPRAVMGEEMLRIYNVAASRARDKAILLHSIHPEALAKMNPKCYRKRMIDYFSTIGELDSQSISASQSRQMNPNKGRIGQEIFAWIGEQIKSEDVFPQYNIGPYKIDLAIIQDGKKQALFIDGVKAAEPETLERSIQHQLVLERAGWNCVRVQALAWHADRAGVEERLRAWMA